MTLERHRSKLVPNVDFSAEGRIFVTDRDGTFPLRHKKRPNDAPGTQGAEGPYSDRKPAPIDWENDPHYRISDDIRSYHSYDPARDGKRKYRPREVSNYERALREVGMSSATSVASSNSLARKLKRSRSYKMQQEMEGRFGAPRPRRTPSLSSADSYRRFRRGQKPSMPEESRASMRREQRRYRSLDARALRKVAKKEQNNNYYNIDKDHGLNGFVPTLASELMPLDTTIKGERLSWLVFIIAGSLLMACGIVRTLLSRWHEYYHPLWSGFLVSDACLPIHLQWPP